MCGKIKVLQPYLLPYSYSLFEPNSRTLAEYGVSLEKAILRDSELLSDVNNAFCNSHPLLAQKVVTRSARAAVSKISADALLAKAISVRRSQAEVPPPAAALDPRPPPAEAPPPPAAVLDPPPPPAEARPPPAAALDPPPAALPPLMLPPMLPPPFLLPPPPAWPYPGGGGEEEEEEAEEEEAAKLFILSKTTTLITINFIVIVTLILHTYLLKLYSNLWSGQCTKRS